MFVKPPGWGPSLAHQTIRALWVVGSGLEGRVVYLGRACGDVRASAMKSAISGLHVLVWGRCRVREHGGSTEDLGYGGDDAAKET